MREKCINSRGKVYYKEYIYNILEKCTRVNIDIEVNTNSYQVYDYNPSCMLLYGQKKQEIVLKKVWMYEKKDLYMTFLLEINEDFDDDLLMDAIELLE